MKRPTRRQVVVYGVPALGLVALVSIVGALYFLPMPTTTVDEAAPPDTTVVKTGPYEGADAFHHGSGTVSILRDAEGRHHLRFEAYDARAGPDVYFYLTPRADADSTADVEEEGLRVLVPGGARGGQATLRGDFNVPLPYGFDPDRYAALVAWCDRFDERFGTAVLTPV